MKAAWVVIGVALALTSGCAHGLQDWIDRTLVTVDVTGVWEGDFSDLRNTSYGRLTLTQSGAKVTGTLDLSAHAYRSVPVDGSSLAAHFGSGMRGMQ